MELATVRSDEIGLIAVEAIAGDYYADAADCPRRPMM